MSIAREWQMATRDETRRELRELAKLADVMPKERSTINPPAPDRASGPPPLPTFAQSLPSSPGTGGLRTSQAYATPLTPSDSIAPAASNTAPAADTAGGRWGWAAAAGGTLVAAMVGGLLLGQALASHPGAHATVSGSTTAVETHSATGAAAAPTPSSAPVASEAPAAAEPTTMVVTDTGGPTVTVRSPRPAHHAVKKTPKVPKDADKTDKANTTTN
jgi:hypothetical protein